MRSWSLSINLNGDCSRKAKDSKGDTDLHKGYCRKVLKLSTSITFTMFEFRKFEFKISFDTCVTHIIMIICAQHISFQLDRFSVKYKFPFPILRFLP